MSYLLHLDESGQDHRNMPYEVRGGITLHAKRLWAFIRAVKAAEDRYFGGPLHDFGSEIKGSRLLDKERFKWAEQDVRLDDAVVRRGARAFLQSKHEKRAPRRFEFTAYGQASLRFAVSLFEILADHDAKLFAVAIPPVPPPPGVPRREEYLGKDMVFLLERFSYLLEKEREMGLLVMDESDKTADRSIAKRFENYFTKTTTGRYRSQYIVPSPIFVASDMAYPVQVADVCIYCINWGFRLPAAGMDKPVRPAIEELAGDWLRKLQWQGEGYRDGKAFVSRGIAYVANPFGNGRPSGRGQKLR